MSTGLDALARGTVDRASHHRTDPRWLAERWRDQRSRVLVVDDGAVASAGDPPALVLVAPDATEHTSESSRWFLGLDDDGTAVFATPGQLPDGHRRATLREFGALLSDRDAGLLTTAVALDVWHRTHQHCSQCGTPTEVAEGGMVRVCPLDDSLHHPRVDPAVIMSVIDDDDRLLLAHQARWPARRYSTLAGFVEPGESLEQAVAREVVEEAGITVSSVTYLGSQPWPFPRSLMLGFAARASSTEITEDGVEIAAAQWFTRAALATAVTGGDVVLPPRVSIARRLIERWYGGHLDGRATFRDG